MIHFSDKFKVFVDNKIIYLILILTLIINITLWYLVYHFIDFARDAHVLHYNFYFGIDLLGNATNLIFVPIISIGICIINFFIAFYIYAKREEFFLSYFLLFAGLFANIELILYLLGIVNIEY